MERGRHVHTDERKFYRPISQLGYIHKDFVHSENLLNWTHISGIERAWTGMKGLSKRTREQAAAAISHRRGILEKTYEKEYC